MCKDQTLDYIFEIGEQIINDFSDECRARVALNMTKAIGAKLMKERTTYQNQKMEFGQKYEVDFWASSFIASKLRANPITQKDRLIVEDSTIDISENSYDCLWIVDPLDGSDMFMNNNRTDFGIASLALDKHGRILISLYLLPARQVLYMGLELDRLRVFRIGSPPYPVKLHAEKTAVIRRPRDWKAKNINNWELIEPLYEEKETSYKNENLSIHQGQELSALDCLQLIEGQADKMVYYSKPWDFLVCAAMASAVAKVELFDLATSCWENVFPLDQKVQKIIESYDRVLFSVELDEKRQGHLKLYDTCSGVYGS